MNGNRIVADSNSLIYMLGGNAHIASHLEGKECWISVITELELFGKKGLKKEEIQEIEALVEDCFVIDIIPPIKSMVKKMRQQYSMKLPDTIIAATALYLDLPLLTADADFKKIPDLQLILITD